MRGYYSERVLSNACDSTLRTHCYVCEGRADDADVAGAEFAESHETVVAIGLDQHAAQARVGVHQGARPYPCVLRVPRNEAVGQ